MAAGVRNVKLYSKEQQGKNHGRHNWEVKSTEKRKKKKETIQVASKAF